MTAKATAGQAAGAVSVDSGPGRRSSDPLESASELASLAAGAAPERSDTILWRVVDLFERDADRLTDEQIKLFDLVLARLTDQIETTARIMLSNRLANNAHAPPGVVRRLSQDDTIEIAGPVLTSSSQIAEEDLLACARTKGQPHLLAISKRTVVPEAVTQALSERGDGTVLRSIAENKGASFSELGFRTIIGRAGSDDDLTQALGMRADIPPHQFLRLLALASERARARLEATSPHAAGDIRATVRNITRQIESKAVGTVASYADALRLVETLHAAGSLREAEINRFAAAGQMDFLTAALATLADLPVGLVEVTLRQERAEGILVIARAIGLTWATVRGILIARAHQRNPSALSLEQAAFSFERLKPATAQQALSLQRSRRKD